MQMKKWHRVTALAVASLSPFLLGACGGGSEGVTGSSPRFPSVSGNWRGEWSAGASRPAAATLSLTQSGDRVQGTLTVGRDVNEITGTISEFGVLEFTGRDTNEANGCDAYYSDRPHLSLSDQSSELGGPVRRVSWDCVSGRRSNEGGVIELERVL
jgi:hypothetical protein